MALVGAAVCPHPPLLVPEVGVGVDVPARAAAVRAVVDLVANAPDVVVVVGDGPARTSYEARASGTLAGFGVDLVVPIGPGAFDGPTEPRPPDLPLSLTIGAWLLRQSHWTGDRRAVAVPASETPESAAALGAELAKLEQRVALLCMGDGSARRTEKAPGWWDERAEPFDAAVAGALATADRGALLGLDPDLADALLAAGRASWQVLAGAAGDGPWSARLDYADAPFGVGYFVASWTADPLAGPVADV